MDITIDGTILYHIAGTAITAAGAIYLLVRWAHRAYRRYHIRRCILRRLHEA